MGQVKVDLRSDTVTQPDDAMRKVMANAPVGDDVYGDDPSVQALQQEAASILGKEHALFLPSGTQSNLVAIMAHCERGDEYIVGQQAHTYRFEGGGAAVLGSIVPQPLDFDEYGRIPLQKIRAAIKPDDPHFARSRLLCLENTWNGQVVPQDYLLDATGLAREYGLATHLDGARLANAAVASNVSLAELAKPFDTVSLCLSKGLGAPVGSVLAGPRDLIAKALRWRKVLGGGMRQAGVLAAAGRYALKNNIQRLAEDHRRARELGDAIAQLPHLELLSVATNMVFVKIMPTAPSGWWEMLLQQGIQTGRPDNLGRWRLVLHKDVDDEGVQAARCALERVFGT